MVVHSMDRLARNLDDLRALVREFTDAGVAVEFVREHMGLLQVRLTVRVWGFRPLVRCCRWSQIRWV